MLKILFPTDFSSTANNAFIYALHTCKKLHAKLFVLHVYSAPIIIGGVPPSLIDEVTEKASVEAFEEFNSKTTELHKIVQEQEAEDIHISFTLEEGSLLANVENFIQNKGIDLLVIGTTGKSGFDNKVFGSNTVSIIKSVDIPVLCVPHESRFSGIKNIGFTTLFDEQDELALDKLITVAEKYNAEIQALYIDNGKKEIDKSVTQHWEQKYADNKVSFHIKKEKDIFRAIFDFLDQKGVEMVCAVKKDKPFFQQLFESSMTSKMSYHLRIPLLVYHEN